MLGVQDIRRNIAEIDSADESPGDRFHDVMSVSTPSHRVPQFTPSLQGFLEEAEGRQGELETLYSRMKREFCQVVQFYGEDPGKTRVDDFFTIFASFSTDFQVQLILRLRVGLFGTV